MKFLSGFGLEVLTVRLTQRVFLVLTLLIFGLASNAQAAKAPNLCAATSRDTLTSCKAGAGSDYWLSLGKCDNLPTMLERKACIMQARVDLNNEIDLCEAQYDARQDVCKGLGKGPYNPVINPADFSTTIDNQYFPLTPGTTYIYEGPTEKGFEHNEVVVTDKTNVILGVTCVVVHDTVYVDGLLEEDTIDYYAQDKDGNVWYFGERAKQYDTEGEIVGLTGSWIAGIDGAKPGIIMETAPKVGDLYRQEFSLGTAEDMAEVLSLNASPSSLPAFPCTDCLQTKDFSALEPDAIEHKLYKKGVGNIQILFPGTSEHLDLISITP